MCNIIAWNDANTWLVRNGFEYQDTYKDINGKTYFEYRHKDSHDSNLGLIYRLPIEKDFNSREQQLFNSYSKNIKSNNMKQEFTLQDILSIKKQTWLDWIKKHLTADEQKEMEEYNITANKHNEPHDEFKDQYCVKEKMFVQFHDDHIMPFMNFWIKSYNEEIVKKPDDGIQQLLELITRLITLLCKVNPSNPLQVAEKVTSVLNELLAK